MIHQPVEHFGVPDETVGRIEYPVAFGGEIDQSAFDAHILKCGEKSNAFVDEAAEILFSLHDEGWGAEIAHESVRGVALVVFGVIEGCAAEFIVTEPQFICNVGRHFGIEYAVVTDECLETVSVTEQPVNHETAEGCAGGGHAVGVNLGVGCDEVIDESQDCVGAVI